MNILFAIVSYLIGSIPFAYILVKKNTGNDIRQQGSGNVGAMNSFETTNKRWLGITVLLLDALKGLSSVLIAYFFTSSVSAVLIAGVFAVLGHNFSIYLKFKGGRGLATAAGVFLVLNPVIILLWGLMFLAGWFIIKKNVHIANITASLCMPLMIFYTPPQLLLKTELLMNIPVTSLLTAGIIISLTIVVRHIEPIRDLIKSSNENKQKK